ncbi:hypothetical protein ACJX0J_009483, partial [Zea mays]
MIFDMSGDHVQEMKIFTLQAHNSQFNIGEQIINLLQNVDLPLISFLKDGMLVASKKTKYLAKTKLSRGTNEISNKIFMLGPHMRFDTGEKTEIRRFYMLLFQIILDLLNITAFISNLHISKGWSLSAIIHADLKTIYLQTETGGSSCIAKGEVLVAMTTLVYSPMVLNFAIHVGLQSAPEVEREVITWKWTTHISSISHKLFHLHQSPKIAIAHGICCLPLSRL